jgi:8-oxo-dGTP pyrophosphatase MutT (NUDIX family)
VSPVSADPPPDIPAWLTPLTTALAAPGGVRPRLLRAPTDRSPRRSAVLILLGESSHGPDVLIIQRASTLRAHAGQAAFPGGALDPEDAGPVEAALREAEEETGLDPAGVAVLGTLPELYLPPSDFMVTPVVAWWRAPSPVGVVDPLEVAHVRRIAVSELVDPANRVRVRHPSGYTGPAFEAGSMLIWGFTGGLLDAILGAGGWERPWDGSRIVDVTVNQTADAHVDPSRGAPPAASETEFPDGPGSSPHAQAS